MAGPLSLSFQVDALHSSSISFGRFELESLSWERRSSFLHNRYLEEVEKYAKPGSVTEKKAYFEAHFKKRALLRQASSESQQAEREREREGSNSEESSCSSTITCEEVDKHFIHVELEPKLTLHNQTPKGSSIGDIRSFEYEAAVDDDANSFNEADTKLNSSGLVADLCDPQHDYESSMLTDHLELKQESTPQTVFLGENLNWIDNVEARESGSTCSNQDSLVTVEQHVNSESESDDETPDEVKEQCISQDLINQPSKTFQSPDQTLSSGLRSRPAADSLLNANLEVNKGIDPPNSCRNIQSPLRSRPNNQISETIAASVRQLPKKNPQNSNSKSPQIKKSEKEVRPRRAATPQPSTPQRNEPERPRSAISSTRQTASYRKEISPSVMNSSFRSSGGAEKGVRPRRAATPRPSTPEMSESLRPRSAISSTRQTASYRKEIDLSVMNSSCRSSGGAGKEVRPRRAATPRPSTPEMSESLRPRSAISSTRQIASYRKEVGPNSILRCSGGAEKSREKIMAAGTRQVSRKLELKENPKLCPVSNTLSWAANREKSQMVASNKSAAKASIRTLKPENQTRRGSKLCSTSIVREAVFGSKFAGSAIIESSSDKGSDVHKINESNITASPRNRIMEANKRKEVVSTKERKAKARENGQIGEKKGEVGRSGHSLVRKSMGYSLVGDHRAA